MTDKEVQKFLEVLFSSNSCACVDEPRITVKNGCGITVTKPIGGITGSKPATKPVETPKKKTVVDRCGIRTILANKEKGVFTVVWSDGTNTMITIQPGDTWDDEKALAMCYVKKHFGNTGAFNDIFTKALPAKIKYIGTRDEVEVKSTSKVAEIAEAAQKTASATVDATTAFSEMAKAVGKKRV